TYNVPGDVATGKSFIEFVFISNENLRLALTIRYPLVAQPFSADALIQTFLEADNLSRMAATVDIEHHSLVPFTRPRMCTKAA
ncbi:hypothetical protein AAVH_31522, partial [Aphelenchoides avenae]